MACLFLKQRLPLSLIRMGNYNYPSDLKMCMLEEGRGGGYFVSLKTKHGPTSLQLYISTLYMAQ